ncbi:KAP family NTPase [Clostridium estertheticum]|uniref:P-loop NTPase fold protein n=1 Tax=Clostridium estertheticum TaxID=238834 RepID=UPI0013E92055|nr:P-loop NTPase fold protein [Clostridium estertheticum]MBZ9689346.1 KAP family NTPase [Clostridium estertheticum]
MEELQRGIIEYVKNDNADYAVMINGEWGSGKTYLWENGLQKKIDDIEKNGIKLKSIYISLYGINSLEEISKKIFIEVLSSSKKFMGKIFNSKGGDVVPEIVKVAITGASFFGFSLDKMEIDYSKLSSLKNKVLCFDDLERANVNITDILGYINNLVEHDKIKTIIICYEKELESKIINRNIELKTLASAYIVMNNTEALQIINNKENEKTLTDLINDNNAEIFGKTNEYAKIKEKLIGKTFDYVPNNIKIIENILEAYSINDSLGIFLKSQKEIVIDVFIRSKTKNIRILKQALNDFGILYKHIISYDKELKEIIQKPLLVFVLSVSFEIKSSKVDKDKFKDFKDYYAIQSEIVMENMVKKGEKYFTEFRRRYYPGTEIDCLFFKFAEEYIRTSIINTDLIKVEMKVLQDNLGDKEEPSYKKIIFGRYWNMDDVEFNNALSETLKNLQEGEVHFSCYLNAFFILRHFLKENIIKLDMKQIKDIIKEGLKKSEVNAEYYENIDMAYKGIDFSNDEDLIEIRKHIYSLNDKLKNKMSINDVNVLFNMLPGNISEFQKQMVYNYCDISIFSICDINELYNKLILLSNKNLILFRNIVIERYKYNYITLEGDVSNLKILQELIENNIKEKDGSLSKMILNQLSKTIEKTINIKN